MTHYPRQCSDDLDEIFLAVQKVCEPERLLLGDERFIELVVGRTGLQAVYADTNPVHFMALQQGEYIYFAYQNRRDRRWYYLHPRTPFPADKMLERWNKAIQEGTSASLYS